MRKVKWLFPVAVFIIGFFIPLFPVDVIPPWTLQLVDENGQPVPNALVDQSWEDYSLELWSERHTDQATSDADGIVTFPIRRIRISAFQFVAGKVRGVLLIMNPHASYGPHAHVLCRGKLICSARYRPDEELPQVVIVKR